MNDTASPSGLAETEAQARLKADGPNELARAERRLAEGDLGATVNELSGLDGGAAQAMAAWLEEATARVATERAIAEATTKAVAAVAATGNTLEEALAPPPPSSQPRRP